MKIENDAQICAKSQLVLEYTVTWKVIKRKLRFCMQKDSGEGFSADT